MNGRPTLRLASECVLVTLVLPALAAAETFVLPVIVRGVPGLNGSYWDSEVRIVQLDTAEPVSVRRAWVATAGGGFVGDPTTAPGWAIPGSQGYRGLAILTGADLLQGVNATHAAVALDIQGSAIVLVHNSNTGGVGPLPPEYCCLPGNGQLTQALTVPIQGTSIIPWATSGKTVFRLNVGIINPNSVPATFRIRGEGLTDGGTGGPYWTPWAPLNGFTVVLPAWGWWQINDIFAVLKVILQPGWGTPIENWLAPAFVTVEPVGGLGYYAYATPIYSPLNDPEFVAAVPVGP